MKHGVPPAPLPPHKKTAAYLQQQNGKGTHYAWSIPASYQKETQKARMILEMDTDPYL